MEPDQVFPEALLFNNWESQLPCRVPQPPFIGEVDGFEAIFEAAPVFHVRVTDLAGKGCILAFTCNHAVCDSVHLQRVQEEFAKACSGSDLLSTSLGLSRSSLSPESFGPTSPILAEIVAEVKTTLEQEGCAKESQDLSFKQRWEACFGIGHSKVPVLAASARGSSVSCSCLLLIPKCDMDNLKQAVSHQNNSLSTTDLLAGLIWVLNSVGTVSPLPGQAGSGSGYGVMACDAARNSLGIPLPDFFGNTSEPYVFTLSEDASLPVSNSRTAFLEAVGRVACCNWNALKSVQAGKSLHSTVRKLLKPIRFEEELSLIQHLKETNNLRRCSVSNVSFLNTQAALERLQCGASRCLRVETFVDRAGSVARVNVHGDESSPLIAVHLFCDPEMPHLAEQSGFMATLLPNSAWKLSCD